MSLPRQQQTKSFSATAVRTSSYPVTGQMPSSLTEGAPQMRLCFGCGLPKIARTDGTVLWHLDPMSETEPCIGVEPQGGVPGLLIHCQHCTEPSYHFECDHCGEGIV